MRHNDKNCFTVQIIMKHCLCTALLDVINWSSCVYLLELCGKSHYFWEKSIYCFLPTDKHNIVLSNHSEFLSFLLGTGGRNLRSLQTSIVSVGESTWLTETESYGSCYLIWPAVWSCHTTLPAIWLGMNFKYKLNTEKTLCCFLSSTCVLFRCTTKKNKNICTMTRNFIFTQKGIIPGFSGSVTDFIEAASFTFFCQYVDSTNVCSLDFINFLDVTVANKL